MQRRLLTLEESKARVESAIFGNGKVGMDERLRRLEEAQERHEAARLLDARDIHAQLNEVQRILAEQAGGWLVARRFASIIFPIIIGLLSWIAVQLARGVPSV